jgi:hypothetical protein
MCDPGLPVGAALQISSLVQTTPSIKTRKCLVELLGPRITDVANSRLVVELFDKSAADVS